MNPKLYRWYIVPSYNFVLIRIRVVTCITRAHNWVRSLPRVHPITWVYVPLSHKSMYVIIPLLGTLRNTVDSSRWPWGPSWYWIRSTWQNQLCWWHHLHQHHQSLQRGSELHQNHYHRADLHQHFWSRRYSHSLARLFLVGKLMGELLFFTLNFPKRLIQKFSWYSLIVWPSKVVGESEIMPLIMFWYWRQ